MAITANAEPFTLTPEPEGKVTGKGMVFDRLESTYTVEDDVFTASFAHLAIEGSYVTFNIDQQTLSAGCRQRY